MMKYNKAYVICKNKLATLQAYKNLYANIRGTLDAFKIRIHISKRLHRVPYEISSIPVYYYEFQIANTHEFARMSI